MRKKFLAICLVVAVVLSAVLVVGCPGERCTIEVNATLCGVAWNGTVNYTLTPASGSPISGTSVPATHSVDCGNWTCAYADDGSGPANAFLKSIKPSANQVVSEGKITFTLEFEKDQDAWITFDTWSRSGETWKYEEMELLVCDWLDVHFIQGVYGCEGYQVAMNETSELDIHWVNYQGDFPGAAGVVIWVINDWDAVVKDNDAEKVAQVTSFNGMPVPKYWWVELPGICETVTLDVETSWVLEKCLNYTKTINWFGVSTIPWEEGMEHPDVLFELVFQAPGTYTLQVTASAEVELLDDVDVNDKNDKAVSPLPPLTLTVTIV